MTKRRLTGAELDLLKRLCPEFLDSDTGDPLDLPTDVLRAMERPVSTELLARGITDGEINKYGLELEDVITKLIGTAIDREVSESDSS